MSRLRGRVTKLEKSGRCRCQSGVVKVVALRDYRQGEPEPEIADEDLPPPCPRCGTRDGQLVVFVEEVIVTTRQEAEAVLALNEGKIIVDAEGGEQ
jgi:hypothetical protein